MNPGFTASTLQKFSIFLGLSFLAAGIYLFQTKIENPDGELQLKREQAFNAGKFFQLKLRLDSITEIRSFNYEMLETLNDGKVPERDSVIAKVYRLTYSQRFPNYAAGWISGFRLAQSGEAYILEQVKLSENAVAGLSDTLLLYETRMRVDEVFNNQQFRLYRILNIARTSTPVLVLLGFLLIYLGLRKLRKTTFNRELELLTLKVEEQKLTNRKLQLEIAALENKLLPESVAEEDAEKKD